MGIYSGGKQGEFWEEGDWEDRGWMGLWGLGLG